MVYYFPMMYQDFSPLYSPFPLAGLFVPIFIAAIVWTVILKGFALWYAARAGQRWWFVALLIVNTLGILDIIYLIWFRPTQPEDHPHHPHHHHHETPVHHSSEPA